MSPGSVEVNAAAHAFASTRWTLVLAAGDIAATPMRIALRLEEIQGV